MSLERLDATGGDMQVALEHWRIWLRALRQTSTLLGLAMVALTWTSIEFYLGSEHASVERAAFVNLENLARAFEANVIRSVQEVDKTLLILRTAYEQNPAEFDFAVWLDNPAFRSDLTWQFSITDANGILKLSSAFPITKKIDVSDYDHVRAHMEASLDRLLISAPLIGQTSKQWSVQLTRRIRRPDDSFGGVISAAVNPQHFSRFYDSINIGDNGSILLAGFDGVVRAYAGLKGNALGNTIIGTDVFQRFRREPAGSYIGPGRTDGTPRLLSYRVVEGYPLIVVVGAAEAEVFAAYRRKALSYNLLAVAVTVLILVVVIAAGRHRVKLERAREALIVQFGKFHAALNNMPHGLCMWDANQRVVVCNTRFLEMYGLDGSSVGPGTSLRDIVDLRIAKGLYAGASPDEFRRTRVRTVTGPTQEVLHLNDGRAIALSRQPMPGGGWVATHEDITERQRIEAQIAYMASHDALTGLANRMLMRERLDEALERLKQTGEGFALLSIDLDRFKFINDTMGHPLGDQLLREIASRLLGCAREADTVGRIGGDEFAILQSATGDQAETLALAEQVLRVVTRPCRINGNEVVTGASIGIAIAPRDGTDAEQLSKNADIALYRAKADGRNKCLLFESEMNARVVARRELELALRAALVHGEFELFYQPIIDLQSGEIRSCEALLRWWRPGHGLVLPGSFIAVTEDIGLITPLGEWVLRQACTEATRWPAGVRIAVNLSPAQFKGGNIAATVIGALASSGLAPDRLELEITESVLLLETEQNLAALHQLRQMGVRIAFDDFGIGYSSLSYLTAFPFDTIKIDRQFTKDVNGQPSCRAIVDAVAGVGRALGIETIAEGVETEDQLAAVRQAGCTNAQGFFIAVPQPISQLTATFASLAQRGERAA
jgi:diguanylate cyclase (GGDEF)-like protein